MKDIETCWFCYTWSSVHLMVVLLHSAIDGELRQLMHSRAAEETRISVLKNIWHIAKWRVKMLSCKSIKELHDSFTFIVWRHHKIIFTLIYGINLLDIIYMCILKTGEVAYCRSFVSLPYFWCSYKIVWFIIHYISYINKSLLVRINYLFIFVDDFNNWLPDNTRNVTTGTTERETKFYYYSIIIGLTW